MLKFSQLLFNLRQFGSKQIPTLYKDIRAGSEWFQKDVQEMKSIYDEMQQVDPYKKKMYEWQHPLELEKKYKERKQVREESIEKMQQQTEKIVLHPSNLHMNFYQPLNPDKTKVRTWEQVLQEYENILNGKEKAKVSLESNKIFAIVQVNNSQYKVTPDDLILVEKIPYDVGDLIEFDTVLLVGTQDFTAIGRPYVTSAKVLMTLEEHSKTEKVRIFKKKRRKGYKKLNGHRQEVSALRVEKIEFEDFSKTDESNKKQIVLQSPTVVPYKQSAGYLQLMRMKNRVEQKQENETSPNKEPSKAQKES